MEDEIARLVPKGTDPTKPANFMAAAKTFTSKTKGLPPTEWTFGGYAELFAFVIYVTLKWNTDYLVEPMVGSKTRT